MEAKSKLVSTIFFKIKLIHLSRLIHKINQANTFTSQLASLLVNKCLLVDFLVSYTSGHVGKLIPRSSKKKKITKQKPSLVKVCSFNYYLILICLIINETFLFLFQDVSYECNQSWQKGSQQRGNKMHTCGLNCASLFIFLLRF